jgi:RNA-binding protein YhbY
MSVAAAIWNRIKNMQKGKPFSRTVFARVGSPASIDKALSRLVQAGQLERVVRGVYMRPKYNQYVGRNVRPSPTSVMHVIAKSNGETIQIHGAEAVRRLGLSTQMQMLPTYYTSGSTRELKVGNAVVRLQHVSRDRLQHAGTNVGMALTALYYIGKEGLSAKVVSKITNALSHDERIKLLACRMPEWMRSTLVHVAGENTRTVQG